MNDLDSPNKMTANISPIEINGATRSFSDKANDPFAAQRTDDNNPFKEQTDSAVGLAGFPAQIGLSPNRDRRESKEWGV